MNNGLENTTTTTPDILMTYKDRSAITRYIRLFLQAIVILVVNLCLISTSVSASPSERKWNFVFDNDFLSGSGDDRGYTGGLRITSWVEPESSWQGGLLIFTPGDLETATAIRNDQPYANLIFGARSRQWFANSGQTLIRRTISVGLLGTGVAEAIQSTLHSNTDSPKPRGYDNQISDGGELTARVGFSRYSPIATHYYQRSQLAVILETTASAGYITDASVGVGFRLGSEAFDWADAANDFLPHLDAPERTTHVKRALFGGVRIRARIYNAFLQGQFRHSDVTYAKNQLNPVIGEAWLGVVTQVANIQTSYTLRYQTSEIRQQGRTKLWASINLTYHFN